MIDSMLLTLPTPTKRAFEFVTPHDFAGHRTSSIIHQLSSPPPERTVIYHYSQKSPAEAARKHTSTAPQMSGNPQHSRSLPPPPPLSLPDPRALPLPGSGPHSASHLTQGQHGSLPPPPGQWHGSEDHMRFWLQTKGEEERRRQEEERAKQEQERSRQEQLRLEQRKVEYSMLQESVRAGVPPLFMPLLFIALGGGANLANIPGGTEYLQQYISQMMGYQQQTQTSGSPETTRAIPPPPQPPSFLQQVVQSTPQTPIGQSSYPAFHGQATTGPVRSTHSGVPHSSGRGQTFDMLPRLATGQTAAATGSGPQAPTSQPQEAPSPLYFHHWTPPASQAGGIGGSSSHPAPATPLDYTNSPKKRKATTSHPSVPPPSTRFSSDTGGRRIGHLRQRSDLSTRGTPVGEIHTRPSSSADSAPLTDSHQQTPQHQQQHQQQHPLPQIHEWNHQPPPPPPPPPRRDSTKAESPPQHPETRGTYGPGRSSQPHSNPRRPSEGREDVEMS